MSRRLWTRLVALVALGLFAAGASALDLNVYGLSYHTDREAAKEYNELNFGLGLRHDVYESGRGAAFVEGGAYKDSKSNLAKFAGVGYQFKLGKRWRVGGALSVFSSPSYNSGSPLIVPLPLVTYDFGPAKLNLSFLPRAGKGGSVAALYLSIPLGG